MVVVGFFPRFSWPMNRSIRFACVFVRVTSCFYTFRSFLEFRFLVSAGELNCVMSYSSSSCPMRSRGWWCDTVKDREVISLNCRRFQIRPSRRQVFLKGRMQRQPVSHTRKWKFAETCNGCWICSELPLSPNQWLLNRILARL